MFLETGSRHAGHRRHDSVIKRLLRLILRMVVPLGVFTDGAEFLAIRRRIRDDGLVEVPEVAATCDHRVVEEDVYAWIRSGCHFVYLYIYSYKLMSVGSLHVNRCVWGYFPWLSFLFLTVSRTLLSKTIAVIFVETHVTLSSTQKITPYTIQFLPGKQNIRSYKHSLKKMENFGDSYEITDAVHATLEYNSRQRRSITNSKPKLVITLLSDQAISPKRSTSGSVGYDLYAAHDTSVPAHGKAVIKTDIAMILPLGCYGRVAPRSGLAARQHIDVGAGVIDPDYRGNIGIVIFNHGNECFKVRCGDRIAQLILERYVDADPIPTVLSPEEFATMVPTDRGVGGFGHTGRR